MNFLNSLILRVMDTLLGWLLAMPRSAGLVCLALLTALALVLIRPLCTPRDLLRRCAADRKRLGRLIRLSRRRHDKAAAKRYRATRSMVAAIAMKAEWRPLLVSLLPIAMLGTWAFQRMAYLPPAPGQDTFVAARLPVSADGQVIYLVPQEGLSCPEGGFVQQAHIRSDGTCQARWTVRARGSEQPYVLEFRTAGRTCRASLRVGQATYEPPVTLTVDPDIRAIQVRLDEARLWGIGGIARVGLQPWLTAYFLVSIPAVVLLKRLLRIL